MSFADFLKALFDFLERNVPWFLLGYRYGKDQGAQLKAENVSLQLQLDVKNEAEKIAKHNAGLSNDELRAEILESAKRGRP